MRDGRAEDGEETGGEDVSEELEAVVLEQEASPEKWRPKSELPAQEVGETGLKPSENLGWYNQFAAWAAERASGKEDGEGDDGSGEESEDGLDKQAGNESTEAVSAARVV